MRGIWIWPVVLVASLASCDRHSLTEVVPERPGSETMERGRTPPGPQAGPLSTETPRILAPRSRTPVLEPPGAAGAVPLPGALPARPEAGPHPFATRPFATRSVVPAAAPAPRILWENTASGQRAIWLMNGPIWEGGAAALPQVPASWRIAGAGDFNGDAHADIVWQHPATGRRGIWFMNDLAYSGQFADLGVVSPVWQIAAVADFNHDGHPDLLWQHLGEGHRVIWFMNGPHYTGQYAALPQVDPSWEIAGVADFNADGKPDIVWQHRPTGQRAIWFMNGAVWEGPHAYLPQVDPSWEIAGVADFNADGKPDLVWQHLPTGQRAIWLMNGAVWEGASTLLPVVPPEWRIAGTAHPPGPPVTGPWAQVAAGQEHSCALTLAGQAYCWGRNNVGQLGDGTETNRSRPQLVLGGHRWRSLAVGPYHNCGITTAGAAYCWGSSGNGQLGNGSIGYSTTPVPVASGGDSWASLSLGQWHSCGRTPDGRAYCWGHNAFGQLGNGSLEQQTTRVLVAGNHSWRSVSAGGIHSCGVNTAGQAYCWGNGGRGRLGTGDTEPRLTPALVQGGLSWTSVSAGTDHSCGITATMEGYCWGRGDTGQRGDGSLDAGRTTPGSILNGHRWVQLHAGFNNSCGITAAGQAYCWGWNGQGQIGNGTQGGAQTVPALVSGGHTWTTLSPGGEHTCGSVATRDAYCWGRGMEGQIGNGTAGATIFPTPVRIFDPQ